MGVGLRDCNRGLCRVGADRDSLHAVIKSRVAIAGINESSSSSESGSVNAASCRESD